jgi:hypothetical protein
LFDKISTLAGRRLTVLASAVSVPPDVFLFGAVAEIETALDKIVAGKKPFSQLSPLKKRIKDLFSEILVEGRKVESQAQATKALASF